MLTNLIALGLFPLSVLITFAHLYKNGNTDIAVEGSFDKEFFGKRQTTTVKGIMIMIVFFHHFSHVCTESTLVEYVYRIGHPCITFFFFLAGYTAYLGHSRVEKIDLKKLWIGRAWRLYLPIMIFSILQNNFLGGLLVFFIFTDLAFILFKTNKSRLAFIAFGNILFFVLLVVFGAPEYWYDDILTYFMGVGFAMYKSQVVEFFKSNVRYALTMIVLIAICIPTAYCGLEYIYYNIAITIFSFFGCLLVVLLMMRLNPKSKVYCFIGKYTWEIFLFHQMFMVLFNKFISKNSIVLILSAVCTMALSVLVFNGINALRKKLTKAN